MLPANARPFDFAGDSRGVLCVHGFTGTPFEMRYLGETLATRGFTVVGPLLAGHGDTPAALDATTWRDWLRTVERAFDDLKARCRRVAIVGQSLGGLLALHLARLRGADVAVVGSLAAPLWLPRYAATAIPVLRALSGWVKPLSLIPKIGGSDVRDAEMGRQNPALPAFPVNALASLLEFTGIVRRGVDAVSVPTFVAHGRHDHTAPPACATELVRRIRRADVRFVDLPRSYHLISIDVERDQLAEELGTFLAERL